MVTLLITSPVTTSAELTKVVVALRSSMPESLILGTRFVFCAGLLPISCVSASRYLSWNMTQYFQPYYATLGFSTP